VISTTIVICNVVDGISCRRLKKGVEPKRSVAIGLAGLLVGLGFVMFTTGCVAVNNLPASGRVSFQQEPERQQNYWLYIPTYYSPEHKWPLVVACHGTLPYDSATKQLDEWKGLAEQRGFLLAVPELKGVKGDLPPPPSVQLRLQAEDEATILSVVRAVSAAYRVDDMRIFLRGWSAGGYAVLYTGLRNPDVFRALSMHQPNFDLAFVDGCIPFLDPHQPIQVTYGTLDTLQPQGLQCIDWLRARDFEPLVQEQLGWHRRNPMPVYNFFSRVVRDQPFVRVKIHEDANDPMRVTFSVRSSFEPRRYLWDFGDESPRVTDERPSHRYTKPGIYNVRVGAWADNKDPVVRQIQVQIPRARLGAVGGAVGTSQPK